MTARTDDPITLIADDWRDYGVLDSGDGRKLEQVGPFRFVRPEPQALWRPRLAQDAWDSADALFTGGGEDDDEGRGRWRTARPLPETWTLNWDGLAFLSRLTPFRHLAFFPEHSVHWRAAAESISGAPQAEALNLFGYTGLASMACARAGARVTHVDASKKAIGFARENQDAAGLAGAPIRWICDDAFAFAQREVRRGKTYDVIFLDPPKYGRGPNGEIWRLEESLFPLLQACAALIAPGGLVILSVYAVRLSAVALLQTAKEAFAGKPGRFSHGDMCLPHADDERLLPTAHFVRWRGASA